MEERNELWFVYSEACQIDIRKISYKRFYASIRAPIQRDWSDSLILMKIISILNFKYEYNIYIHISM